MIELRGVSLTFPSPAPRSLRERFSRYYQRRQGPLPRRDAVTPNRSEAVTALRDVDLTIERGERVGVIGLNGAGKTTLLKVLCGIYTPTRGRVVIDGDVACLFEFAIGFEMEANGWDNIMTRGLLLGMTPTEIRQRTNEIADFTELGPALDRPVKTYSNGMFVRLAFAVSTAISPDVLLLDEVIAAGDIRFQEKAQRRLEEMVNRASILVLVSHSLETIRQMCGRVIWLDAGRIQMDGDPEIVTAAYLEASHAASKAASGNAAPPGTASGASPSDAPRVGPAS